MVSPLQQCSNTPVSFGQRFLSKAQYDNIGALHTLLTWLHLIFYLFPQFKSALKGQSFCDATDIIKNVTEELKSVPQNGCQERFKHIYSCWQKFIVEQEDCFERKKVA